MPSSLCRAFLAIGFCALAAPALAHAHLKSCNPPADGATATAPTELALMFSEAVNPAFSGVTLSGPDGDDVATGPATPRAADPATLVVPLPVPLRPGTYAVAWHALAVDGHKTAGSYRFTVKP